MSGYRKQDGSFRLAESDKYVGSWYSKADIVKLLAGFTAPQIGLLPFKNSGKYSGSVKEAQIVKLWKRLVSNEERNNRSFHEIVLKHLIIQAYPNCEIKFQVKFGSKALDFLVAVDGKTIAIEYFGPGRGRFIEPAKISDDKQRKVDIEAYFKCECVIWPFWIQCCEKNVRALFDENVNGLGAIWSCSDDVLLGNYDAGFVQELTNRFRAERNGSYGYFYEAENSTDRVKPEHPILAEIQSGTKKKNLLIPKAVKDEEQWKWLPNNLIQIINND